MLKRRASSKLFEAKGASSNNGAIDHKALSRSLEFMAKNYLRPITLRDVIKHSGMSRRGFLKAFIKHLGWTPGSFMREARIEHAKQLLIEQDISLREIASRSGFKSDNTFCVAFSRAAGMSPKQFQRRAWLSAYRSATSQPGDDHRPWFGGKIDNMMLQASNARLFMNNYGRWIDNFRVIPQFEYRR